MLRKLKNFGIKPCLLFMVSELKYVFNNKLEKIAFSIGCLIIFKRNVLINNTIG